MKSLFDKEACQEVQNRLGKDKSQNTTRLGENECWTNDAPLPNAVGTRIRKNNVAQA